MTKKNKNAIWIADEAATLDVEMNRALLAMLWAKPKKDKRKKAKRIYKELLAQQAAEVAMAAAFVYTPDPERPVQFVMPRSLEESKAETVRPAPNTEVYATKRHMELKDIYGDIAGFKAMPDGGFRVSVEGYDDNRFQSASLTAEQFAAFKQWVMEN